MTVTYAMVGRPNVGKSTLFNKLTGRQHAIVDDQPGVTRDRREGDATLATLRFRVIDTAGLEEASDGSLEDRMRGQTELAIRDADITMLVVDAKAGVTPVDSFFAGEIRKSGAKVILLANKCEGKAGVSGFADGWALGLGCALQTAWPCLWIRTLNKRHEFVFEFRVQTQARRGVLRRRANGEREDTRGAPRA